MLSYPDLEEFGEVFWSLFDRSDTVSKIENIKSLEGDGWLQGLSPQIQAQILKSAPVEVMKNLHHWEAIHKDTIRLLFTRPQPQVKSKIKRRILGEN